MINIKLYHVMHGVTCVLENKAVAFPQYQHFPLEKAVKIRNSTHKQVIWIVDNTLCVLKSVLRVQINIFIT